MPILALAVVLLVQGTRLPQTGVVIGQIRGPDGNPAAGVRVFVISASESLPTTNVQTLSSIGQTDSAGRYRLEGIPPGRYIVAAGLLETPTYYPGVNGLAAARGIVVSPGQTVADIDFALLQSPGVRVSGRVTALPKGTPAGMIRAALRPLAPGARGAAASAQNRIPLEVEVQSDGSFEFLKIPSGQYDLRFNPSAATTTRRIEVGDQDVGPLEFNIGAALLGRIEIEGGGVLPTAMNAPPGIPNLSPLIRLQARRANASGSAPVPQIRSDGSFLWLLPAGEYNVAVTLLPFGLNVTSISFGSVNLLKMPLKLDGPPATPAEDISVILTTKPLSDETAGVRVTGRVTGLPGEPSSNEFWVRLQSSLSAAPSVNGLDQQHIGEARVSSDGTFEVVRVPPGVYTAQVFPRGAPNIGSMQGLVVRDIDISGVQLTATNSTRPGLTSVATPRIVADVRPPVLQAHLEFLGGPAAKDCGHASLAQLRAGTATEIVNCVATAIENKTAFLASFQQQGFDSIVMMGIAAPPQGGIVTLPFDSMGGNVSTPRPCASPKIADNGQLQCN